MDGMIPKGYCLVQLRCGDASVMLRKIAQANVSVYQCISVDELTIQVICSKKDLVKLKSICETQYADMELMEDRGLKRYIQSVLSRPVLIMGLLMMLMLSVLLPRRVLFLRTEGNLTIPDAQILEAARHCGMNFGVLGKSVRSEEIKNEMIRLIPDLRWVGVNVRGCVATICVTEDLDKTSTGKGITKIVASRDGVITDCTVLSGQLLCTPGQAVKQGDTLISGLSSEGLVMKGTSTSGEIYANTVRSLRAVMPSQMQEKGIILAKDQSVSLLIGKKRIFIYNNSRISGAVCDKIYEEKYITLPNGFQLPLGFGLEHLVFYEAVSDNFVGMESDQLEQAARNYLTTQMVSGEIRDAAESTGTEGELLYITGVYVCHELIGREETEDLSQYGENN